MPETPSGIVYPDASSHTRLWEHLQALAESAEAAFLEQLSTLPARVAAGAVIVNVSSAATGTAAITFPAGRFEVPPIVKLTNMGGTGASVFNLQGSALTKDGMTVTAIHRDGGSTATAAINVHWEALTMSVDAAAG